MAEEPDGALAQPLLDVGGGGDAGDVVPGVVIGPADQPDQPAEPQLSDAQIAALMRFQQALRAQAAADDGGETTARRSAQRSPAQRMEIAWCVTGIHARASGSGKVTG